MDNSTENIDPNNYKTVLEKAAEWNLSERSVRNYCAEGRIPGAIISGKTWYIPVEAEHPQRIERLELGKRTLLSALREENKMSLTGGIYHKVQIELTYNSNHIEGSRLSHDQTRYIYETNTVAPDGEHFPGAPADDVIETANHFRAIDLIIDQATRRPSENMLKRLHLILKNGTSDSRKEWFNVGGYKKFPNEVGGQMTTAPADVPAAIKELLTNYNNKEEITLDDILAFHVKFEQIHPFQDGNGRIGRLIMFKECLRLGYMPFIVDERHKMYYYRGIKEWDKQPGFLRETCLSAQDIFRQYLDQFEIGY